MCRLTNNVATKSHSVQKYRTLSYTIASPKSRKSVEVVDHLQIAPMEIVDSCLGFVQSSYECTKTFSILKLNVAKLSAAKQLNAITPLLCCWSLVVSFCETLYSV